MLKEDKELTRKELFDKYTRIRSDFIDELREKRMVYPPLEEDREYSGNALENYLMTIAQGTLGEELVILITADDKVKLFCAQEMLKEFRRLGSPDEVRLIMFDEELVNYKVISEGIRAVVE